MKNCVGVCNVQLSSSKNNNDTVTVKSLPDSRSKETNAKANIFDLQFHQTSSSFNGKR